ncbi:MAG TPA: transglutaminase domain-containing protein [Mobilitalea sp.]|nr:transglutaminase domain-containing protein [Mobilitalea sp.]
MKKIVFIVIVFAAIFTASISTAYAESYFTNNVALDSTFNEMKKEFLEFDKDEVIPLESYGLVLDGESNKKVKLQTKKISEKQIKAAAERKLNEIRVIVEIKEEELGGLTKQDYQMISEHFEQQMLLAKNSEYGWDTSGKTVSLYLDVYEDNFYDLEGLVGNFKTMGKEKDEVNQADLKVSEKITRYLNQSKQKGNKVSSKILQKLPGKVEQMFLENELSQIVALRMLADIHKSIYYLEADLYDGSESIDDIIKSYEAGIYWKISDRDEEKLLEYYEYAKGEPSAKNKDSITKKLINGELSDTFTSGFEDTITLNELAELYFGSKDLDDKIEIENNIIDADSPDYIKNAFIYGMIDDQSDLDKPLTRLEAARKLIKGAVYGEYGITDSLMITDCNSIPIDDQLTVSSCLSVGMKARIDKFEPKAGYKKEEAIVDSDHFYFYCLRGFDIPLSLEEPSKIKIGENTINLIFEDKDEIKNYIDENFENTVLGDIKLTKKYMKIDTGGVLIEFFTPENGIKFTIKNGVEYVDFTNGTYGPGLSYKIEPKIVKSNAKVDMNIKPDTIHTKLYAKLDKILAKIIKKGMTQKEKVKAIHDYVVNHITYDSKYKDDQTLESVFTTIDKGRGVCGDYALLFMNLCKRADIPCVFEASYFHFEHAWNAVYINGKWLFVDTTWDDDDSGKVRYTYFLKDKYTFMKTHLPAMGVPDEDVYTDIDHLNIKNQDELRGYLLQNFYWVDGYKLTFRMADKDMKPFIGYMRDDYVTVSLKYDSKKNLYTVIAKGK